MATDYFRSLRERTRCNSNLYFFFNDTPTTEIYTLSLHDALPIFTAFHHFRPAEARAILADAVRRRQRSEEHTSELQSPCNLVCRLLLEKKKEKPYSFIPQKKKIKTI